MVKCYTFLADTRRLAITHLRPDQVSESQKDNAKFIIGIRNPKDAAVSMFCHFHKDPIIQLQGSWDQFFELYSDKQCKFFIPRVTNGLSHPCHLDESPFIFQGNSC